MNRFPLRALSAALLLALPVLSAHAIEERVVSRPDGTPVFLLRYFGQGEGPFMSGDDEDEGPMYSTWSLGALQKDKIQRAADYWAEIIRPVPGQLPAIINVGTYEDEGAAGLSEAANGGSPGKTQLQAALQNLRNDATSFGSHGQFVMGKMNFDTLEYVPSQLPRPSGPVDLTTVALHEIAHGLGMGSTVEDRSLDPDDNIYRPYFSAELSDWTAHLRDDNGKAAQPGQIILCEGCHADGGPIDTSNAFDLRKDQGYFAGRHVSEVMNGAMPGLPVWILWYDESTGTKGIDNNFMSHSELKNSLMSHQDYRNYTTFMEAELAVLQDLDYDIDRRNFYGYSVYGSDQHIVNPRPYFQRNADGTGYLNGQYNTATLGLGLHVYGSRNTIVQTADLLTRGAGGAGIRVDGVGNTIEVAPGTRIHADGQNGRGILFAYGRDHNLVQRGDVQATGDTGVAAVFSFGNNLMGNGSDYRGSYLWAVKGNKIPSNQLLDELNGPLVKNFDLTGRLAGSAAAIYMSPNGYVQNINVMRGARIEGDVYSDYAQQDDGGSLRLTHLTFGKLADASGRATDARDDAFSFRHDGNIQGRNLSLQAVAGVTSLNGQHVVDSVAVDAGATLKGNSRYTLEGGKAFLNAGTVSPGNSVGRIEIQGDYLQTPTGRLTMEVDADGQHDTLAVSGSASLDGDLTLAALPGWYGPGWSMNLDELVQAGSLSGAFSDVNADPASPTLRFTASRLDNGRFQLAATRPADAYSQYAVSANGRQTGRALDAAASGARADLTPLYQALDFSSQSGADIGTALEQLSAQSYSAMVANTFQRERLVGDLIDRRRLAGTDSGFRNANGWNLFATPFGGGAWQNQNGSIVGYDASSYGVAFGAEKSTAANADLTLGFYGAVSGQSVRTDSPFDASGRSTALTLGVNARYAANANAGAYAFGHGQLSVEDARFKRTIQVNGYSARNSADWTGLGATIGAGAGYRWALGSGISAGPLAALDYSLVSRPSFTESGSDATRLGLDAKRFDSLRSRLGVDAVVDLPMRGANSLQANLQVTWNRELLNRRLTQSASFTGYDSFSFTNRNAWAGRDAMGVAAGISWHDDRRVAVGAGISSQFFRAGYHEVSGNVSATWRF